MVDLDKEGLTGKLVDVIDKPHIGLREITDETKKITTNYYLRFFTNKEYEERRKEVLSTPLPGYE